MSKIQWRWGKIPVAEEVDSNPLSEVLDDRLGTHIRRIARLIIDAKTAALRPLDLTVPQYSTLLSVKHLEPTSAAQLARTGMGTPQATATMLSTLENKGLISRRPSPMHQKLIEVRLTALGAKTIEEADDLAEGIESRLRAAIGEELFDSVLRIEQVAEDLLQ
ncbi:MarR family transcriptional regulator [Prescottella defluvii]